MVKTSSFQELHKIYNSWKDGIIIKQILLRNTILKIKFCLFSLFENLLLLDYLRKKTYVCSE
jgi:hypothetical protein